MNDLLARLQAAWVDLSQREQILVGAAGALAAISIVWFGMLSPLVVS